MNIWVNGCFDIIHTGHIDLLWYAKLYLCSQNDNQNKLYVGIDSDERIKFLKGSQRPINCEHTRQKIMKNLKMVDEVFVFKNELELQQLIIKLKIDYIIVGEEYKDKNVIGSEFAKYGVAYYQIDSNSTTNIINKIKNLCL